MKTAISTVSLRGCLEGQGITLRVLATVVPVLTTHVRVLLALADVTCVSNASDRR